MNERPIPEEVLEDKNSVEMLRLWIANRRLYVSMNVGMYKETSRIPEEKAWGIILADVARHLAHGLASAYEMDCEETLAKIRGSFDAELNRPTSNVEGGFAQQN